jgi:hypothetical protein
MRRVFIPSSIAVFSLIACSASAASWNEGTNGDISGNRLAPTLLTLDLGSNTVVGSFGSGDLDYLRIDVPAGRQLSSLLLTSYSGASVSFWGVQSGTTFTVTPAAAQPANMLGYGHAGAAQIGTNILPTIGAGAGSTGFTPPLPAGSYTFWMQDTGGTVSYGLNFTTVPAPGVACAGFSVISLLGARRRR